MYSNFLFLEAFRSHRLASPAFQMFLAETFTFGLFGVRVKGSFSARSFLSHFIRGIYYGNGLSPHSTFLRLCTTLASLLEERYLTVQMCQSVWTAINGDVMNTTTHCPFPKIWALPIQPPHTETHTCSQIYFILYNHRNSQSCNLCFLNLGTHQNHLLLSCVFGDSGSVGLEWAWRYSLKAPYMILMTARVENHSFRPVSSDSIIRPGKLQVQRVLQILKSKG